MIQKYIEIDDTGRIKTVIADNDGYADEYDVNWCERDKRYYAHLSGGGTTDILYNFLPIGFDIFDIAGDSDTEWCSECKDNIPTDNLCKHIWWDEKLGWYSTPDDRKQKKETIEVKC